MSVARGFPNAGHFYSNIVSPNKIDIAFTVDADNTNGLGVASLKSNGFVRNVFMHTSATPGSNDGALNPNPAAGYAIIQLKQNFNVFLGAQMSIMSPLTGGNLTATVANTAYVITALGTATLAQWHTAGLPAGITPAVGVAFVAIASATIGGSATVKLDGLSGILCMEVVGNPVLTKNSNIGANGGEYVLVKFLDAAGAVAAPAEDSVVSLSLYFDNSSVTVDGL